MRAVIFCNQKTIKNTENGNPYVLYVCVSKCKPRFRRELLWLRCLGVKGSPWGGSASLQRNSKECSYGERPSWGLWEQLKCSLGRCEQSVCILPMEEACFWCHWGEKDASSMERSSRGSNRDDLSFLNTSEYSVMGLIQQEECLDVLTGFL